MISLKGVGGATRSATESDLSTWYWVESDKERLLKLDAASLNSSRPSVEFFTHVCNFKINCVFFLFLLFYRFSSEN